MPFSIAICDLDHFKKVNDLLGHQEGDEVLKRTATAIRQAVRSIDFVSRLGGEEFGVILPNSTEGEARLVAERIRMAVVHEFGDAAVPLTISCGVATYGADGEGRRLFRSADLALYRAKELGRNRTVTFGEDQSLVQSATG
jgi:diguanylate cyclase (GGDEF)-like protein